MDFGAINWLAVVACVLVSMISGSIWYNPKTFFPVWWKGIGKGENDVPGTSNMTVTWGLTLLASLVQAIAMSIMVTYMGATMTGGPSLGTGVMVGFMFWCGFVAPTSLVNKLFAGHALKIWAIEAGNHLINFVLFGAILGAWR